MDEETRIAIEQIVKDCPDFKFYEVSTGYELEVSSAIVNEKGQIYKVFTSDENGELYREYLVPEEATMVANWLPVPGIGYLRPGTRVVYKREEYCLKFGWHTNISNQEIYSWYLEPLKDEGIVRSDNDRNYMSTPEKPKGKICRTLYHNMINEIEDVNV